MTRHELLQFLPPAARYRRVPLDDAHNALSYWSEAAAALVEPDEELFEAYLDGTCALPWPDEAEMARLQTSAENSRQAIELLWAGVRCGRVQLPEFTEEGGSVSEHAVSLSPVRQLFVAWLALTRLRIAEGRYADAAHEVTGLGEMGHLLCCGESFNMHYLMGTIVMAWAGAGIHALAEHPAVPAEVRHSLLTAVNRWLAEADRVTQCQRVELCSYALPEIERLTTCRDLESLVDQVLERHFANGPMIPEEGSEAPADSDDGRCAWRRDRILFLLQGHPDPFEPIATVRQMGRLVTDRIAEIERPAVFGLIAVGRRLGRVYAERRFRARLRRWPAQLRADWPYEYLGLSDAARQALAELKDHVSGRQWADVQPPTDGELRRVREQLRLLPNALGVLLADALTSFDITPTERTRRARLEATRKTLVSVA